jgi:hypothetical protein
MPHARPHTRKKTPKRVPALPDLEHAKSAVLSSLNYPPREDTQRGSSSAPEAVPFFRRSLAHVRPSLRDDLARIASASNSPRPRIP